MIQLQLPFPADVTVARIGYTVFEFTPRSANARCWMRAHVHNYRRERRADGAFLAENRCARDIAAGMTSAGLVLE